MSTLRHKVPCKECPWRKESPAGYLGGHKPELYADAVGANEVPSCHLQDFGPDDPKSSMCAGALITMRNQCLTANRTEGGEAARQEVSRSEDCFSNIADFYSHHAGEAYQHPLLRSRKT